MDLAEFLNARLDEDEAAAKWSTPGPWHIAEHDPLFYCVDSPDGAGRICKFGDRSAGDDVHNSLHIARHDPSRVLREVEAKRAILNEQRAVQKLLESTGGKQDRYRDWILRHLAAVYSDHPDYRKEWKP